ncbi:hypothetical protein D3C84_1124840 [compost metagenome]
MHVIPVRRQIRLQLGVLGLERRLNRLLHAKRLPFYRPHRRHVQLRLLPGFLKLLNKLHFNRPSGRLRSRFRRLLQLLLELATLRFS